MTTSSHTPGPWRIWDDRCIWDKDGGIVLQPFDHGLIVSDADLQLMAAAPDLLAALEDLLPWLEDCRMADGARTAIAKAKGQ